jgi:hypothetical protein
LWNCVVSAPSAFPWHDAGFHPPAHEELIMYQFHIGVFYAVDANGGDRRNGRVAKFLDVLERVEYRFGFPNGGTWREVFNSDVYDNWVNPIVAGNGAGVFADGPPMHGMPTSAEIVIPANGLIVFVRGS